jgi:hypothetical protein
MKKLGISLLFAISSSASYAQNHCLDCRLGFNSVDLNGDGLISFEEIKTTVCFMNITEQEFISYDFDGDGGLNETEWAYACDSINM